MSLHAFGRLAATLALTLLVYFGYRLVTQWEPVRIGGYEIERNTLTGMVKIQTPTGWKTPFDDDPYADSAVPDDLRRIQITDVTWGENGVLCARAVIAAPAEHAVKGRMAFLIRVYDQEKKMVVDKAIRATVDWPGGQTTPFALRTTITTPDTKKTKTTISLLPALYSGA